MSHVLFSNKDVIFSFIAAFHFSLSGLDIASLTVLGFFGCVTANCALAIYLLGGTPVLVLSDLLGSVDSTLSVEGSASVTIKLFDSFVELIGT